jgi:hypothetical protein
MEKSKTLLLQGIEAWPSSPFPIAIPTVKNGYRSRTKLIEDKQYYLLADSHTILNRQKYSIICVSYWKYMRLKMSCRVKCMQLRPQFLSQLHLSLKSEEELIKFRQNLFKQEVKHSSLRSTRILLLCGFKCSLFLAGYFVGLLIGLEAQSSSTFQRNIWNFCRITRCFKSEDNILYWFYLQ